MKCSIITIHHIHNFGSIFQAYSLFRFLANNGFDADIIDYRPGYYEHGKSRLKTFIGRALNIKPYLVRKKKFEDFLRHYDRLSDKQFRSLAELEAYYKDKNQIFIAGGDQLWNNYHPGGRDDAYKLTFAHTGRKIAYGTSMGRDNFNDEELRFVAQKVSDFEKIMLREKSTVSMLQKHTNVDISHVIDPVGLLDVEEFKKIAKTPAIKEPYAVMYLADSSEILDSAVEVLSKKHGLKIVHICGFKKKCYCDKFEKDVGPEEILGYILHADFVLSASFHATMFSLLFNKQFASLLPGEKTNARIVDILKLVGLENRIIRTRDELSVLDKTVDYQNANAILEKFKTDSKNALLQAMTEKYED
ncbi:MAG: polysaccharide pyruvyl transferase family protein [Clostridia bacterium]|jgi:hypothetical protein